MTFAFRCNFYKALVNLLLKRLITVTSDSEKSNHIKKICKKKNQINLKK